MKCLARSRFAGVLTAAAWALQWGSASAQVSLSSAAELQRRAELPAAMVASQGRVSLVLSHPGEAVAGAVSVSPGFSVVELAPEQLSSFMLANPDLAGSWSPPRRALLDQVGVSTRSREYWDRTGNAGQGAIVGVIDTGIDPRHPDFLHADGRSRIVWMLDFSLPPQNHHPELEERFGCTGAVRCAVYSRDDLSAIAQSPSLAGPSDAFGHGTHVASLSAGNGGPSGRYQGIAPEADLIVVRADRSGSGAFFDGDILLGTAFVFEQAEQLGLPAVVNLSLGSDFGPHDGRSDLERGLASFVGDEFPGRSIIVAAGNSGSVFVSQTIPYPMPLGVHTEVHVPRESSVRVPVLSPVTNSDRTRATIFVYIATRPGDALEVGLDVGDEGLIPPLPPGTSGSRSKDGTEVTIINGETGGDASLLAGERGAVVVIDGEWDSGSVFALRFEGHGSPRVWVQSEGELSPSLSLGALLPRARKEGTINIPASHPDLIAVGATVNRITWPTQDNATVEITSFGGVQNLPVDSTAYFSSTGPTADGGLKPDIVAPGAFLIGAMSTRANPAVNPGSIFSGQGVCGDGSECLLVDDFHAVTTGTSMAAPLVAGAAALLLARDPTLTQRQVRALLQAGARQLEGFVPLPQQASVGTLDVSRSLDVMLAETSPIDRIPNAEQSWLAVSASFVHPDEEWPLEALLELRDAKGQIADGFAADRLTVEIENGLVSSPLKRVAPGLWRLRFAGLNGAGGRSLTLRLLFDGAILSTRELPVGTDPGHAEHGASARGGCALGPVSDGEPGLPSGLLLLAILAWRSRRRELAHRSARCT